VIWLLVIAVIGVCFAFPMKKRFINDEQLPFPEGMAAGVVMDMLHESDEKEGLFKAKLLMVCGAVAAAIELWRDEMVMRVLFAARSLPEFWDDLCYGDGALAAWLKDHGLTPKIGGVELKELTIQWDSSIILLATGGLTGIRAGTSMLIGGVLNYFILAPWMISKGVILPHEGHYGFRQITLWALWGGVACMTTSSLYSFFSKPKVILDAIRGFATKRGKGRVDVLADIELPLNVSLVTVPLAGAVLVIVGHAWFGIAYWLGAVAIPLVFIFSLIAVNSTGLTSITPVGALGKLTQLTFGALAPRNIVTNVMSAGITAEVSSNAANLLMDIKPGYMLGAKPRQQAVAHLLGAVSGLSLSVPIWYFVFIQGDIDRYCSDKLPMPAAVPWKAVAELLMTGLENLHPTARVAVAVGAVIGIVVEVSKQVTKGRFPLSAVGLGLAFVLSFHDIWAMFLGSFVFWLLERKAKRWEDAEAAKAEQEKEKGEYRKAPDAGPAKKPWFAMASENTEAICAGVIAGGALMGIGIQVLDVFFFPEVAELHAVAPVIKKAVEALTR
jgi:uncharacterized oligopeptide transporter (OPT) family protein